MMMTKPYRILYVSSYYDPAYVYGGPVISGSTWCEMLAARGMQVDVLTTNANGGKRLAVPTDHPLDMNGVQVHYLPLDTNLYFYSRQLAAAVKRQVPDYDLVVLQAMWGHALLPAARTALKFHIPYAIMMHGQLLPWSLRQKALKKRLYLALVGRYFLDRAAGLQCTDPMEASALHALGIRAPTYIVPHAVSSALFRVERGQGGLRQQFGIPHAAPLLMYLGRLHHKKNPRLVLDGFRLCGDAAKNAHLVFVGPDDEGWVPRLKAAAAMHGLQDRVHFTGLLDHAGVVNALADADVLLMPSALESENFGMSAAEALAAGVPVVASAGVPVAVVAQTAGAGLVVDPSATEISHALRSLLSQPEHLQAMKIKARAVAMSHYSQEAVTTLLVHQVKALIETGQPAPD